VVGALHRLAAEQGAEFLFDEPVTRILVEDGSATGVETTKGSYEADIVLVNADYPYAELHLLDDRHRTYDAAYWEKRVLAPSAFVAYLGVNKQFEGLAHHTLFLDEHWEEGFDTLFDPAKAAWPERPSYYVNVPSRTDPTAAPEGCDTLFILVALAPGIEDAPERREAFYTKIMDDLEQKLGEDVRSAVEVKRIFALEDFAHRYNAYKGTALGLSHTLFQTALWRPSHKSKKVANLYYSGHYTHPGIGVPMTLISSTMVAKELAERHPKNP